MAHGRRNIPDPTDGGSADRGPAPSDLLQMWINGRTSSATDPVPDSETDPDNDSAPDSVTDPVPDSATRPESSIDGDEPAAVEDEPSEPEVPEPEAEQDAWWPSDVEAAAETDAVPDEPSQWWPYEPTDSDPTTTRPAPDAPERDSDADEQPPQPSDGVDTVQPNQQFTGRDIAAVRARGWASFGVAPTAEDVLDQIGTQGVWPDHITTLPPIVRPPRPSTEADLPVPADTATAEETRDQPADVEAETAPDKAPRAPRSLDMSSTAHWTLADFEDYIGVQTGDEPARWMGDPSPAEAAGAEPTASEPGPAQAPVAPEASGEPVEALPTDEPTVGSAAKDHPSRVRGLLARMGLTREPEDLENLATPSPTELEPGTDPTDPHEPPPTEMERPPASAELADETTWVAAEQEWSEADVEWVEPEQPEYDPDATAHFDWTAVDFEGPPPGAADAEPEREKETPLWVDGGSDHADDPDQDHQEWYDDNDLMWTSDDGGYTWFSTDGQGWNAEIGEPIDVPAASVIESTPASDLPVESDPVSEAPHAEQDAEADRAPWPEEPAEPGEHDIWPTTFAPMNDEGHRSPAQPEAARADSEPQVPQFVEYKPRGPYRPVLGALFVVAAILAVVAIFWAVSKGSQAATGIAAGVTAFALAFWWGLLSWTPTVVSVHGSMLEVARGAEGEHFDLRRPDLAIEHGDDPTSRSWRTTITRPNGTELVIPASAVDPVEFTSIVQHYRAEAATPPGSSTHT